MAPRHGGPIAAESCIFDPGLLRLRLAALQDLPIGEQALPMLSRPSSLTRIVSSGWRRKAIEVKRQKIADYSISRRKSDLTR